MKFLGPVTALAIAFRTAMPAQSIRTESMRHGQIYIPIPVDVDIDDIQRAAALAPLCSESAGLVNLQSEWLAITALNDVEVSIAVHIRPLKGVFTPARLKPTEQVIDVFRSGERCHEACSHVLQQSITGTQPAIH